jgi:hypothetical protein
MCVVRRPGVLPFVSDPHQCCGTALYCSWPSTTYSASRPLRSTCVFRGSTASHTAYSCCCCYCCLRPLLCVPRCAATPPLPRDTSHLPAVATTIVVTVAGIIHASRRHKPVCPYPVFGDVPATEPDRPSLLECAFQKENRTLAGAVSAQKRARKWTRAIP